MPSLPSLSLDNDVFHALQGLAQERHAPSLEAFVQGILLQVIEDDKEDKAFLALAKERLRDPQPRLSHDQVWGH